MFLVYKWGIKGEKRGNYAEGILRGLESSEGKFRRVIFGGKSSQRRIFEEGDFREGDSSRRAMFVGEFLDALMFQF